MRPCKSVLLLALAAAPAFAQVPPAPPASADPASKPPPLARPASVRSHPASAPVSSASDAGATERGLQPVMPGKPGVTTQVQDVNAHGHDAQGHLLDSRGQPVGQKPAPASTR